MSDQLTDAEKKKLAALLRLAMAAPMTVAKIGSSSKDCIQRLENAKGALKIERALLQYAVRAGLLGVADGRLVARREARSFLKRYLVTPEKAFAVQHGERHFKEIGNGQARHCVEVNLDHSPLASLARLKGRDGRGFLSQEALSAGERLHADFTRGQLQPHVTQTYEPRLSAATKGSRGGVADLSDSAMAARNRVTRALEAIGPELSGVAVDVCCFMKGLETVERERQWPQRSAKLMLRTALMSLHRHYTPPQRSGGIRHWGGENFRPEL